MIKARRAYSIIFLSFLCIVVFSQTNLVNNPSFETYTSCPTGLNSGSPDEVKKTVNWYTIYDTPDYFNSCATSTDALVPKNAAGYQNAATGNAYAGFIAYDKFGFGREILAQQLSTTLTIGQTYYVSLKFCLAEYSTSVSEYMPCDKVGVRFSTVKSTTTTPPQINNFAHVYSSVIISDTMNWTIVSGSFIADSLYKYLMIGNFFDDLNTDTLSNPPYGHRSYFFVDDICVSTSSITCLLNTGIIIKDKSNNHIELFPNPADNVLMLDNVFKDENYEIINIMGTIVKQGSCNGNKNTIDVSDLTNGLYFVMLREKKMKLLISH